MQPPGDGHVHLPGEHGEQAGQVVGVPVTGHVGLAEPDQPGGADPLVEVPRPVQRQDRRARAAAAETGSGWQVQASGSRVAAGANSILAMAARTGDLGTTATSGQLAGSTSMSPLTERPSRRSVARLVGPVPERDAQAWAGAAGRGRTASGPASGSGR